MINYNDLNLSLNERYSIIKFNDIDIKVLQYLPVQKKVELLQYVVSSSLDNVTGCFSPIRVEVYFGLAICNWYTNVNFELNNLEVDAKYDLVDSSGLLSEIMKAIPSEELDFISDLVEQTVEGISAYNSSAAGIIHNINSNTSDLNEQIQETIKKVNTKENIDIFKTIKDMVEKD